MPTSNRSDIQDIERKCYDHRQIVRWPYSQCAANKKIEKTGDRSRKSGIPAAQSEQDVGNQKTTEHKEKSHSQLPEDRCVVPEVRVQHSTNRDGAQTIYFRSKSQCRHIVDEFLITFDKSSRVHECCHSRYTPDMPSLRMSLQRSSIPQYLVIIMVPKHKTTRVHYTAPDIGLKYGEYEPKRLLRNARS